MKTEISFYFHVLEDLFQTAEIKCMEEATESNINEIQTNKYQTESQHNLNSWGMRWASNPIAWKAKVFVSLVVESGKMCELHQYKYGPTSTISNIGKV